jgi:hypothetical protein
MDNIAFSCRKRRERGRVSQPLAPDGILASDARNIRTGLYDSQHSGMKIAERQDLGMAPKAPEL